MFQEVKYYNDTRLLLVLLLILVSLITYSFSFILKANCLIDYDSVAEVSPFRSNCVASYIEFVDCE